MLVSSECSSTMPADVGAASLARKLAAVAAVSGYRPPPPHAALYSSCIAAALLLRVRIPPLALDPYLVEQRYAATIASIFASSAPRVSNFVILHDSLRPRRAGSSLLAHVGRPGGPVCA